MLDRATAYGLHFMVPAKDTAVGRALRDSGEFARVELDFLLEYAGESGTFVDVGANLGAICLPFAKARPRWRVAAVEAQRPVHGLLSANALNNGLENVAAFHAAAGATAGLMRFPTAPLSVEGNFGSVGFKTDGPAEPVRVLTLDGLAPRGTDLIKIDVEGFEPEVLKGAGNLIAGQATIWVAEAGDTNPEARDVVIETFRQSGYETFWLYAPFVTPLARTKPDHPLWWGDHNVVALPPGKANAWQLPPAVAGRSPATLPEHPYLARYGY